MKREEDYEGFAPDPVTGGRHEIRHLPKQVKWWNGIFQHEENEVVGGGANAVANLPHQQLADRTEWLKQQIVPISTVQFLLDEINKLRKQVYSRTPDGVQRIRVQLSRDAPTDPSIAWIGSDSDTVLLDPEATLTLEGGQVLSLLDSGCRITVGSDVYEFASAETMGLNDVTICGCCGFSGDDDPLDISNPVFDDTVPADSNETIPPDDTIVAGTDTCCCCHSDKSTISINANNKIDEYFTLLERRLNS